MNILRPHVCNHFIVIEYFNVWLFRNDTFESSNVRHSEDESSEGSGDEYEESQAISRSEDEIEYDEAPKPKLNVMSFAGKNVHILFCSPTAHYAICC